MRTRCSIALLLPLACLLGCTLPTTPSSQFISGNWSNWQIQTGTSTLVPPTVLTSPPTGVYLVGAMQTQGSQVTGVFQTNVVSGGGVGPVNFTGSFDSTTSLLTLGSTPAYLGVQLTLPSNLTTLATGNLSAGCPPPPSGGACYTAIALFPAAGAEIAPLNGIYTGTLTGTLGTTGLPGHIASLLASLTLTQASTPNADGSFPLTGTITFISSSDLSTTTLTGTVSGEGIALANVPYANPVAGPAITLTASTNPAATQITVTNLDYTGPALGTPYATLSGTLTRQ
jgi:hypothetical protein